MNKRPQPGEYAPYFETYVRVVPEGDIRDIIRSELDKTVSLLKSIPESKEEFRYAPGKWTVKQVIGHTADTERVMAYRLLRVARGDRTPLPGFDENLFMEGADFNRIPMSRLIDEFATVRESTLYLMEGLPDEAWSRVGSVGQHDTTALAIAYILAGHAKHHMNTIKERYLAES